MKTELLERSSRIDAQNSKISELLQQNQMFVAVVFEHIFIEILYILNYLCDYII